MKSESTEWIKGMYKQNNKQLHYPVSADLWCEYDVLFMFRRWDKWQRSVRLFTENQRENTLFWLVHCAVRMYFIENRIRIESEEWEWERYLQNVRRLIRALKSEGRKNGPGISSKLNNTLSNTRQPSGSIAAQWRTQIIRSFDSPPEKYIQFENRLIIWYLCETTSSSSALTVISLCASAIAIAITKVFCSVHRFLLQFRFSYREKLLELL